MKIIITGAAGFIGSAVCRHLLHETDASIVCLDKMTYAAHPDTLARIVAQGMSASLGQLLWRVKPDFSIADGLEIAFAPGFPVPDAFVDDVKRMTYGAYTGSHDAFDSYTGEEALPQRLAAVGKPALAIMGAEEQVASDPKRALAAYRDGDPGARTALIAGAGHSPNVEKPAATARLVLAFAKSPAGPCHKGWRPRY